MAEREDGIVVVVGQLAVGILVDGDGILGLIFIALHDDGLIAEGSYLVALLLHVDDGPAEILGDVRGVIAELLIHIVDGHLGGIDAQRIAGIQHFLVEQYLTAVIHARLYGIGYRRQLHGELTALRVGVDDNHLQRVAGSTTGRIGRAVLDVVALYGLVVQTCGVVVEGTLHLVEDDVHERCRADVGAGNQRQRGGTDVGVALSEAKGLSAFDVTTDDAARQHHLRLVGEGQLTDGVVEVVRIHSRITAVVQEHVSGSLDADVVLAGGHADGVCTLTVAPHDVTVGVLHGILAVVDVEHTAVHRIRGVLVIHEALDVEAALVGEVLLEV